MLIPELMAIHREILDSFCRVYWQTKEKKADSNPELQDVDILKIQEKVLHTISFLPDREQCKTLLKFTSDILFRLSDGEISLGSYLDKFNHYFIPIGFLGVECLPVFYNIVVSIV